MTRELRLAGILLFPASGPSFSLHLGPEGTATWETLPFQPRQPRKAAALLRSGAAAFLIGGQGQSGGT